MEGYWLISHIVLWIVTIVLGIVVLAHSRLLGLLHHRLAPSAAKPLADGPPIGSRVPDIVGRTLEGSKWSVAFPTDRPVLILFISPLCELCNELAPHALDFASAHRDVMFILLSTLPDAGMNRAFAQYRRLTRLQYYIAPALAEMMSISGTPYAVLISNKGVAIRKGLVNHYEHLRSLIMATAEPPGPGEDLHQEIANAELRENG